MAKYRSVQTKFWSDTKIVDDFTPEDKYFYLYLLTNEKSNQLGCYEISIKKMCVDTGYNEETIKKMLDRFENVLEVINFDSKTKEIFIKNWHKYNWLDSDTTRKCIEKEFNLVKSNKLKDFINPLYAPYMPLGSNKKKKEKEKEKKEEKECVCNSKVSSNSSNNTHPTTHTDILNYCLSVFKDYKKEELQDVAKKIFEYYVKTNWKGVDNWKDRVTMWINEDIQSGKIKKLPEWFNKDIKKEEATQKEIEEMKKLLEVYK